MALIEKDGFELNLRITGSWKDKDPIFKECPVCRGTGTQKCTDPYCFGWSCEHDKKCTYCKDGKVTQDHPLPISISGDANGSINTDINEDITEFFEFLRKKYNDPNYKPKFRQLGSTI
jgi:hypothetical protein